MRFDPLCLLSPLLCLGALAAQPDMTMAPAEELKKLDVLVGTWKQSGTVAHAADDPGMPWTAVQTGRWVLGGHFLRQDTRIEFGEAMPGALQLISFTGWDRERQGYRSIEVSNMGRVQLSELHILPSGAMVSIVPGVEQGVPLVDRWVSVIDGDKLSFVGHRAAGDGAEFVHVKGEGERTSREATELEHEDISFVNAAGAEMQRLAALAGRYEVKGSMTMPSMPKMDIAGEEQCSMMFGGTVFATHTKGQPMDYEAFAFMAWDPSIRTYRHVGVSSMGEIQEMECSWAGDSLVFVAAGPHMGQPSVGRVMLQTDGGSITRVVCDGIMSVDEPARTFEATYTERK